MVARGAQDAAPLQEKTRRMAERFLPTESEPLVSAQADRSLGNEREEKVGLLRSE